MPDRAESVAFDRIADRYDETSGGVERGQRYGDAVEVYRRSG